MVFNDTIAAIATAQGAAGISVIRVSGENAFNIVDSVFVSISGKKIADMKGYTACFGNVVDGDKILDQAVALVFKAPHSYTGENVVEISCHGGIFITREILRLLYNNGASPAEAGEFSKRAFLNNKMDLLEAESVINIINANSKASASAAVATAQGALRKKIDSVKSGLVECAANLSVWADFPDEDMADMQNYNLIESIKSAISELDSLVYDYDRGRIIKDGVVTAIVGKPNVGKSTIMNLLSGYDRSIVTDIPGTTRDIVEESINVGDIVLRISDTAGIRETDDIIEKIGVDRALDKINTSELILAVFDNSKPLDDDDIDLINKIKDLNTIAIINKDDLEALTDVDYIKSNIKRVVTLSAKNGDGVGDFQKALESIFDTNSFNPYNGILSSERQRTAVMACLSLLKEALEGLELGITYDAVTVDIECAIDFLMELTGEKASDAIVDNVFSRFCVGK